MNFTQSIEIFELLLGNSSCGILECGFFKKYVINLGIRQEGRICKNNVFHLPHQSDKIERKIIEILKKPQIKKKKLIFMEMEILQKDYQIYLRNHNVKKLIKKKFKI